MAADAWCVTRSHTDLLARAVIDALQGGDSDLLARAGIDVLQGGDSTGPAVETPLGGVDASASAPKRRKSRWE